MSHVKLLLAATMLVGALGCLTVPKVYALFTAETSNVNATATSGTLTLDLKVGGGADCFSYSAGAAADNVNSSCDTLRADTAANELYPGDSTTTTLTIKNAGSAGASNLRVFMPGGCTKVKTASAVTGNGGDPCAVGGWALSIQETLVTGTKCWYPVVQNSACPFNADSLASFVSLYPTASAGLSLGAGPTAQATRTFVVGVQVPATVANTLQGQGASFVLAWHAVS